MGCDIKTICGILTHRNRVQREEIRIAYESKRAEILSKRVISEVLEPLRTLILYLLYTGPDLDAIILNMSRTNNEIDCNTFRYILCSQSISKLHSIIESYTKLFNMSLQDQIRNVFTGNFAEILLFLLNKSKEDFNLIDEELELEKLKNVCPSVTYNISCHCL
uniref:Annexin D5 (Trinotate prediction) n=1 Tax=Henneguya salminicola TaxID=69463 RepID=A0A6G3MH40_HENSL